ncbi:MAG: hypothetical protein FD153_1106 [Rhodospirillaceae bacterium]|nr:MAG: hypothetical protein FD153_1106 [Rhodospirillaceae bacterium]
MHPLDYRQVRRVHSGRQVNPFFWLSHRFGQKGCAEGYMVGRLVIDVLRRTAGEMTREAFLSTLEKTGHLRSRRRAPGL